MSLSSQNAAFQGIFNGTGKFTLRAEGDRFSKYIKYKPSSKGLKEILQQNINNGQLHQAD